MIQEVGVDMEAKCILWVRTHPDYEPLFSILDSLRLDIEKRYWIEPSEPEGDIRDIEADNGQVSTGVEIRFSMSHNLIFGQEFGQK
jgi:proteasome lid subunit RPN8/RPN11